MVPRLFVMLGILAFIGLSGFQALAADASGPACGSGAQSAICFGEIDAPDRDRPAVLLAATETIDVLYSPGFHADLQDFREAHAGDGQHAAAWQDLDPDRTILALQAALDGQRVATYGGVRGWFLRTFFGNTAYDGSAEGPILLNRAALPRSPPSIANTFAHEIAHRVGLRHPHSGSSLAVARCEPPYVIGSLVEKHASGAGWRPGPDDCHLLQ